MEKQYILFLPKWYPSDADSMLGLFVKNHAKAAVSVGYKVTVAYIAPLHGTHYNRLKVDVNTEGNLTEVITYYPASGVFKVFYQIKAWSKSIRTAIKKSGKPSLVHAHILTRTGLMAMLLSWYYGITYIITEHWSRYFNENLSYKGLCRKYLTQLVIKHSVITTVVSRRLYNAMRGQGLNFNAYFLDNVVDTSLFNLSPRDDKTFRFISISCFEEKSKNLRTIIDAADIFKKSGVSFELMMVGDGADKELIAEYARNKNITVNFTGTLSPTETSIVLNQSHCLILSSNYETYGIVVYEALSSGVPVITSDVADLRELVDEKCGIVIDSADRNSLSTAMLQIYNNYPQFNREEMRGRVIDRCSMNSVGAQLDSIYQQFIK